MRPWHIEELEKLITWLEKSHQRSRGKPAGWINTVKEDMIFPNGGGFKHITGKKARDKYTNMKKAWEYAKTMQEQSGFGLKWRFINSIQICRSRQLSAIADTPAPLAIRARSS